MAASSSSSGSSKKKLLITGGSGYLGRHLSVLAAEDYIVHATCHTHPSQIKAGIPHQLDLTDRNAVLTLIKHLQPDAIIHTAAINPGQPAKLMVPVNRDGSRHIAEGATDVGARLVHVSSDTVHSGLNAPYADDAIPTPVNEYGRAKAAGEAAVAEINPSAAIVRTSLIYGLEEMDRGTTGFAERLLAGEELILFQDHLRQPIWVETLSLALLKLAFERTDFSGLLNVAGEQVLTREAFARKMFTWWQIDPAGQVKAGNAADLPGGQVSDLRLLLERARAMLQMSLPGVDEVLSICESRHQLPG